jgi:Coenzyme F420-dependent N5,N10-methylene tetrahydromethanopterin reductase and related flavin-dependent oxidoreductases
LLLTLQKGGKINWSGTHRAALENAEIFPKPVQDEIPIWIASGGTPQSAKRAGELGLPLVLAIIGGSPFQFARIADFYRQIGEAAGHDKSKLKVATNSHGFIWDTDGEARDLFFPAISSSMSKLGRERGWGQYTREAFDNMCDPEGALYVGSPETVARKLSPYMNIWALSALHFRHRSVQCRTSRCLKRLSCLAKKLHHSCVKALRR